MELKHIIVEKNKMKITVLLFCIFSIFLYSRLNVLNHKENLSTYNIFEVYALGIVMPIIAYPLFPEVSKEHLELMGNNTSITSKSNFFLKSQVIKKAVKESCQNNTKVPVKWNMSQYSLKLDYKSYIETRAALAANNATISCKNNIPILTVSVDYPKKALATLIQIKDIKLLSVEEGLFNVLENKGLYKPYEYNWILI